MAAAEMRQSFSVSFLKIPGNQVIGYFSVGLYSAFLGEGFQVGIIDLVGDILQG
jgi:hypothetical protein